MSDLLCYFTDAVNRSNHELPESDEHHTIERDDMTPERYQQIGELFDAALEQPPAERADWVARASGDDLDLRAEVEKLLANHHESEDFLARPAMDVAAELLVQNQPMATNVIGAVTGQQISHYQVHSLLGAGGMGQVYLAKDTKLGRRVALKLLPARYLQSAEHVRRFEREALAASALNHPNILTIFEFGTEDNTHFLATEFVQGETLRQRRARGPMSVAEILDITVQIVAALQAAHEAGIVHRDIKPDNVMIRTDGIVKVLDFGLAKLNEMQNADFGMGIEKTSANSQLTLPGAVMGTVAYMSPEQARGNEVDARADLFSLGVVLYEMLAGRRPFTGETVSHIIVAILEQEPPPIDRQYVPAELNRILEQMLAKNVSARYPSAAALSRDLKQLVKSLERESESRSATPAAYEDEAVTAIMHLQTNEQLGDVTMQMPNEIGNAATPQQLQTNAPRESASTATPNLSTSAPREVVVEAESVIANKPARRKVIWWLAAFVAIGLVSIPLWQTWRSRTNNISSPTVTAPERNLSYFLTVQRYRNGKPYQTEFQSSGREIFEAGWQFKLNITSPQDGFLYLLNEEASGAYVLLFPLPSHNNGSARLVANERFQSGWYLFDEKPGTEHFRLIWAAQPVPELEALRGLMNAADKGRVSDPTQRQAVQDFLQRHSNSPIESIRDVQNKQTQVRGTGAVLVTLVELEHQ